MKSIAISAYRYIVLVEGIVSLVLCIKGLNALITIAGAYKAFN